MTTDQHQEILRTEGLSKFFPGVKALDNVDFSLRRGEIMALLGENGAGKSTLIKALTACIPRRSRHHLAGRPGYLTEKYRPCTTTRYRHRLSGSQPATQYVGC